VPGGALIFLVALVQLSAPEKNFVGCCASVCVSPGAVGPALAHVAFDWL
jgi:hypothetical protein